MYTVVEERNKEAILAVMNTTELARGSLLYSVRFFNRSAHM